MSFYILVEMMNKSGGTNEFLRTLSPYTSRPRIAQLILLVMGVLTFYDPYISILILGKVITPILKGFPISCEKLAFIVDTTGLPISINYDKFQQIVIFYPTTRFQKLLKIVLQKLLQGFAQIFIKI